MDKIKEARSNDYCQCKDCLDNPERACKHDCQFPVSEMCASCFEGFQEEMDRDFNTLPIRGCL